MRHEHEHENEKDSSAALLRVDPSAAVQTEPLPDKELSTLRVEIDNLKAEIVKVREIAIEVLESVAPESSGELLQVSTRALNKLLAWRWATQIGSGDPVTEAERAQSPHRSAAQESTWHPIESAPKDGTPVLTYDDGAMAIAAFADGYWWDNGAMEPPPTHWMPLPLPPQKGHVDGHR